MSGLQRLEGEAPKNTFVPDNELPEQALPVAAMQRLEENKPGKQASEDASQSPNAEKDLEVAKEASQATALSQSAIEKLPSEDPKQPSDLAVNKIDSDEKSHVDDAKPEAKAQDKQKDEEAREKPLGQAQDSKASPPASDAPKEA